MTLLWANPGGLGEHTVTTVTGAQALRRGPGGGLSCVGTNSLAAHLEEMWGVTGREAKYLLPAPPQQHQTQCHWLF